MYVCMYVCLYLCMYVCMNECMHVCIVYVSILFYISAGSLGSVGVGPWYCMLKGPGSKHLCVLRSFVQVLFSWGGGVILLR
jgi:hypothetical protein